MTTLCDVALVPFYCGNMLTDQGHSRKINRLLYLEITLQHLLPQVKKKILVGVADDEDYLRVQKRYPRHDKIHIQRISCPMNNPHLLPLELCRTVQHDPDLLEEEDVVFFNEADQVLLLPLSERVFDILKEVPNGVVFPHRVERFFDEDTEKKKSMMDRFWIEKEGALYYLSNSFPMSSSSSSPAGFYKENNPHRCYSASHLCKGRTFRQVDFRVLWDLPLESASFSVQQTPGILSFQTCQWEDCAILHVGGLEHNARSMHQELSAQEIIHKQPGFGLIGSISSIPSVSESIPLVSENIPVGALEDNARSISVFEKHPTVRLKDMRRQTIMIGIRSDRLRRQYDHRRS